MVSAGVAAAKAGINNKRATAVRIIYLVIVDAFNVIDSLTVGCKCRAIALKWRALESLGCSRRDGLIRTASVVVGEPWIPTLEQRAKRSVQGAGARLQQEMSAAFGPLH